MGEREMSDRQTADWIRAWCERPPVSGFAWPTDGCGYWQHLRFVKHRNENWQGGDFVAFVRAYADALSPPTQTREGKDAP